jgi:hypothetical protein
VSGGDGDRRIGHLQPRAGDEAVAHRVADRGGHGAAAAQVAGSGDSDIQQPAGAVDHPARQLGVGGGQLADRGRHAAVHRQVDVTVDQAGHQCAVTELHQADVRHGSAGDFGPRAHRGDPAVHSQHRTVLDNGGVRMRQQPVRSQEDRRDSAPEVAHRGSTVDLDLSSVNDVQAH